MRKRVIVGIILTFFLMNSLPLIKSFEYKEVNDHINEEINNEIDSFKSLFTKNIINDLTKINNILFIFIYLIGYFLTFPIVYIYYFDFLAGHIHPIESIILTILTTALWPLFVIIAIRNLIFNIFDLWWINEILEELLFFMIMIIKFIFPANSIKMKI